jgi:hypothetical protein
MATCPDPEVRAPQQDRFMERLAAATVCVVGLITGGYAYYFAFMRGPWCYAVARDFGLKVPPASQVILEHPSIPLIVAAVALLSGILACSMRQRAWLVCAFILASLAVAITVAAEVAARLPMDQLFNSLSR